MKAAKPSIPRSAARAKSGDVPGADAMAAAADFGRQQAVVATESACAVFRGFEAIRKIQEDAAHQASERHSQAASRLRGNCSPADVLAIQSDLLRFDVEAATHYWQGIAAAALEMQAQIMDCATHLMDTEALLAAPSAVEAVETRAPGLEAFFTLFPALGATAGRAYGQHAEAS